MSFLKKFVITWIVGLYMLSTFLQTSTTWFVPSFFGSEVFAQSSNGRTNLVAVLVDTSIYGAISGDISWYANTYVPYQSPGTELLVIPLDPSGFESPDIYRILENLYFDGKVKESTSLVGVMILGDIPLPTVDFNDEQFQSLHPYADFEGPPMFRFDDGRGLRVTNESSFSQLEVRHSIIPGRDVSLFKKFFEKLKKYYSNPEEYAVPEIWYDDYQMMQSSFQHDSLDPYLNNLLLSYDRSSHSINRTMTDLVNKEYGEDMVEEIDKIVQQYEELKGQPFPDNASHPDVVDANTKIESGVGKILNFFSKDKFKDALKETPSFKTDADFGVSQTSGDAPVPTLLNAKQIENMFRSSYSIYGDELLSDMEDNLAAGGRFDIPQIDTSLNLIELNDRYAQEYLMKTNLELEQALDKLIQERQYMLKYPLPTRYEHWMSSSPIQCAPDESRTSTIGGAEKILESRYENFYYGRYAGDVQQYDDLHVYRGDYSNKRIKDLLGSQIPVVPLEDVPFDFSQASMGSSFGGFTQQVKSMRGTDFDIDNVGNELELYENTKCGDEDIEPRSKKFWGGASPADLDIPTLSADPTHVTYNPAYYAEDYMRNPTTNRTIGGPQYTPKGAVEMKSEKYSSSQLWHNAHEEFSESQRVDFISRSEYNSLEKTGALPAFISARRSQLHCEPRLHKTFDFHDFFRVYEQELPEPSTKKVIHVSQNPVELGGGVDQFISSSLSHPQIDDRGLMEANWTPWYKELNISDGRELMSDQDEDLIPDDRDKDRDGDSLENEDDRDCDGDGIPDLDDNDIDNDGLPNRGDAEADCDMIPSLYDGDADHDGRVSYDWNNSLGENDPNADSEKDVDGNGCSCGGGGSCGRCNKQSHEDLDPDTLPEEETDLPELDSGFDYLVKNASSELESLGINFDSDYLVVQLSDSDCFYCRQLVTKIQESTSLQKQLSDSCDYEVIVSKGNLSDRLGSIGGRKTFAGERSREMTDGSIWQMEHLFENSKSLAGIPHVFIVDTQGNIVSRAMGDLPQDISSYCPFPKETAFIEKLITNFSLPVFAASEEDDICVPLNQDDDIDDDGIPNKDDTDDIDGDGIPNSIDGDIDGDCIPNTQDPDIDGDGVDNGRDSDCNGNGGSCNKDNDDDSDGLSDDEDPDNDNDGQNDEDEEDADGDGVSDDEDPDDDNDGVEDEDDENPLDPNIPKQDVGEESDDTGSESGPSGEGRSGSGDGGNEDGSNAKKPSIPIINSDTFTPGIPYAYDVREISCPVLQGGAGTYMDRHYRDYHIVDTVVQHKGATNHMLNQSHVLTLERPINDAPYTTFHGIGGNLVSFIYPNMYNVSTYQGTLLDEETIEQNIRSYLRQKVARYNSLLQDQLAAAPGYYAQHPAAYDFLAQVHSSATPNRTYQLIPDSFFEDILGSDKIKRIAHRLYYMSYPWEEKPGGSTVAEYLDNARTGFDIDRKLEYISELYLLSKPGLPEKYADDQNLLPRYVDPVVDLDKRKAYEIAYINSDSRDAMPIQGGETQFIDTPERDPDTPTQLGTTHEGYTQATLYAQQDDAACNIPRSGAVPLLERPDAFACWLKKTAEDPINFELDIKVEADILGVEGLLKSWAEDRESFGQDIGVGEKNSDQSFGWLLDGQGSLFSSFFSSVHAQNEPQNAGQILDSSKKDNDQESIGTESDSNELILSKDKSTVANSVDFTVSPESTIYPDNTIASTFIIHPRHNIGNFSLELSSPGDNNVFINNVNISRSSAIFDISEGTSKISFPLSVSGTKAGSQDIRIKMCIESKNTCIEETVGLFISAGNIETFRFVPVSSVFIGGVPTPILIQGEDTHGNPLPFPPTGTKFSIEGGTFVGGGTTKTLSSSSGEYEYIVADKDASRVVLSLYSISPVSGEKKEYQTTSFDIIPFSVSVDPTILFRLPSKGEGFFGNIDGKTEIIASKLPQVSLTFDGGGEGLRMPFKITGGDGIVRPGYIQDGIFRGSKDFIQEGDSGSILLLPTGVAGEANLVLEFPGGYSKNIIVDIQPSGPEQLDFEFSNEGSYIPGETVHGQVIVRDSRGNLFTDTVDVDLESVGGRELAKKKVTCSGGVAAFTGTAISGGSCGCRGSCKRSVGESGADDISDGGEDDDGDDSIASMTYGSAEFDIQKITRPDERVSKKQDINAMYVALHGNDWGDESRIVDMLKNNKTLAITTARSRQGAQEYQNETTKISSNGTIQDPLGLVKELMLEGEHVFINIGYDSGVGRVYLGSTDELGLSVRTRDFEETPPPPIQISPLVGSCYQEKNTVYVEGGNITGIDFEYGFMHEDINIIPEKDEGSTWIITYKNEPVATLQLSSGSNRFSTSLSSDEFLIKNESDSLVELGYREVDAQGTDVSYAGVSESGDSKNNVGFRHASKGINNFSQGMPLGVANQYNADLKHVLIGDPFLTTISKNTEVKQTDFDAGIGQVVYSSQEPILKVESMDIDSDGKEDMLLAYEDGSIRLLKNDGGGQPFSSVGSMLVIADGLKDIKAGDVDGDGAPDLVVMTKTDKIRVYKNKKGVLEIDGRPVCLDIPNGEHGSVAQTNQVFIEDVDGDAILDFVVYAIDGEVEVFYGGGNSYISTNQNKCDKDALSRNKRELLKSVKLSAGRSFADASLVHRAGLELPPEDADMISVTGYESKGEEIAIDTPSIKTKKQAKSFVKQVKKIATDRYQTIDHSTLTEEGYRKTIDYLLESPQSLRPLAEKENDLYAFMQTQDLSKSSSATVSVSKKFIDQNGGYVEKGDMLTVQVSISGAGPIDYLEKLNNPVVIFKDEYNVIPSFESTVGGEIDWNIGQGYEFRITGANSGSFSYEVMFNGNGHARIELETDMKGLFQEEGVRNTSAGVFDQAYAKGGGKKLIKLIMDDACYKAYRQFDTNETMKRLTKKYESTKKDFFDFFDTQRKDAEIDLTDPDFGMIKKMMGIHEVSFDPHVWEGVDAIVKNLQAGHTLSLDLGTEYLDGYADMLEAGMKGLCKGIKFGETNCGGLPVPFNMAALSPGTANVFGCKLFEDKGLPLLAFPTDGPIPMRPIFPSGAGGYFGGNTSQFRLYVSPTTTNGLGIATCFGPYKAGMNIPSPIGDIAGNCVVLAGPVGPTCDDGGDDYSTPAGTEKDKHLATLDKETYDLHNLGACDPSAQETSGFSSSLSNGPVAMAGKPITVIADTNGSVLNYPSFGGGGNTQRLLSFDTYTLRGGNEIDLKIKGGDVKGMVQCIVRKRFDNQIRYVANNLLSMQLTILFPDFDQVTEGMDAFSWSQSVSNIKSGFANIPSSFKQIGNTGTRSSHINDEDVNEHYFVPRSMLNDLETAFTNPFEELALLFDAIPLVDVRQKRIRMQIPFIFEEDLTALNLHLTNWVERNEALLLERENLVVDSVDAQANKDQIIGELKPTVRAVKKNIKTLELYAEFPTKLYEYIHGWDQYIDEVYSFTDDVLRQLTGRLQENANRYSKYVDTIILLVGIIETRQPLIDFSTNRKTKCAKCTNDNYDYYSCKLSMLCVDLPLLPIPPFRLPDITLDFSQINLGIDIMLPKFVFLPEPINYPRLPDLPDPQNFTLNLDVEVFDIPLIPSPPPLPNIPTLQLDADLKMPNLPPAIKIPHIFPSIKIMVKAADFIGTIFCIFKEGKGLVAEQSVKTRIEQLTQRKRSVEPFDSLSITLPDAPLEGFDYKIDAMLDLKLSFDELYDVFDSIAETVNEGVASGVDSVKKRTAEVKNGISGGIDDIIDTDKLKQINNGAEIDIGLDLSDTGHKKPKSIAFDRPTSSPELQKFHEEYHAGGELEDVSLRLKDELSYLLSRDDLDSYHDEAQRIMKLVSADANVQVNDLGIEGLYTDMTNYLRESQKNMKEMKSILKKDFGGFLETYGTDQILVDTQIGDNYLLKQFATPLFTANENLIDRLSKQEHPLESYIAYQQPIIQGYKNALDKYTAQNLNMTDLIYQGSKDYIDGLSDRLLGNKNGTILMQPRRNASAKTIESSLGGNRNRLGSVSTLATSPQEKLLLIAQNTVVDEDFIDGPTSGLSSNDDLCIPLKQDMDIDDDGIPNQEDIIDVDGDGIENSIDPDIDGDCIPNTTDPDIDGDGVKNGRDRDCNCNGKSRSVDPDDDGDGIPDDEDPDDDNDGIPDEEDNDDDLLEEDAIGQVATTTVPNLAEKKGLDRIDYSSFIEGYFIPGDDQKYHNVMADSDYAKDVWKKNNVMISDMNGDKKVDIISWTNRDILIKYADQNDSFPSGVGGGMTELGPWSSAEQLQEVAMQDDGYVNSYKIWDEKDVRLDTYREGNNYSSMGFSRENSEEDAFIVSMTHKADLHHRKDGEVNGTTTGTKITYALAIPQGFTTEGIEIEIPKELKKNAIEEYIQDGTIQKVVSFDGGANRINSFLENLPPEWYFVKISPLRLIKDEGTWYYKRVGPWSRQLVTGSQKRGDDESPRLDLELIRMKTGETVSKGVELGGYVQTQYAFSGTWTDNGEVLENSILFNDKLIYLEEEGGKVRLELGELYEVPTVEQFQFIAKDQADNEPVIDVVLRIDAPTIDIVDVRDKGAGYDVETELSATIDEGDVAFFVDRFGRWEELNPFTFPVKINDPQVVGGIYLTDEGIGMYDSSGNKRCSCNKKNAKISLEPGTEGLTDIKVDFSQELPEISVIDKQSGASLFNVGLSSEKLIGANLLNGTYEKIDLKGGISGSYVGGSCFKKKGGECEIFIDGDGNVIIPEPFTSEYEGIYEFNDDNESVIYTIQDSTRRDIVRVEFIANPLEK